MKELIYYMPNNIVAYSISCHDDTLETYKNLLIENGANKIILNNEVIYNAK